MLGNVLLGVAILSGLASLALSIIPLVAGTYAVGDQLGLRNMAYASLEGIVPNSNETEFLVKVYWFPNAFAWEYPTAPEGIPKVGFTDRGIMGSLDEVKEFRKIAAALELPESQWQCGHDTKFDGDDCTNIFFDAWHFYGNQFGGSPWLRTATVIGGILLLVYQFFQEWAYKHKPYWMRCQCLFAKGLCPLPKGTRAEIEAADEHVWDRARLVYWAVIAFYFAAPATYTSTISRLWVREVEVFNNRLPGRIDMNPQLGTALEAVSWGVVGTSMLSFLCVLVKWWHSKKAVGWKKIKTVGSA